MWTPVSCFEVSNGFLRRAHQGGLSSPSGSPADRDGAEAHLPANACVATVGTADGPLETLTGFRRERLAVIPAVLVEPASRGKARSADETYGL